jgi:5-methylcytosine-specific restriction endonuclease McrA
VNATKRKSQRKHPEAKAACDARGTKKYRNRHPEKVTEANHRRRALKLNATVPNRPVTAAVQRERKALFDGCCFCGSKGKLTLEHMVPLSRGGLHVPENLLGSCNSCNCKKNNNPVEDWFRSQPFFSEQRWQRLLEVTLLQEASKKKDEANMGAFTKRAV